MANIDTINEGVLIQSDLPVAENINEADCHAQLLIWFQQKTVEELSEILMTYIDDSEHELNKWQLIMRREENGLDAAELSKLITQALPAESMWEWNEVRSYFADAEVLFEVIFPVIEKCSPEQQWQLILKALQRLNKVIEHIDDSGGFRFDIEGQLKQKLVTLFNQQAWSDVENADWLFSHFDIYQYDIFPEVPQDFELTGSVNQAFLNKCSTTLESRLPSVDLSDTKQRWSLRRLANPLVELAEQEGDWQAQCRLLEMSAYRHDDYLAISRVCLTNESELEAEDYLRQAYQQAKTSYDKINCQEHEVQLRVALGEYKSAWRIGWQLFTDKPSFNGYKKLTHLQKKTGEIDALFIEKVEPLLASCYVEKRIGFATNFDDVLAFYIDRNELEKARVWILSHKARNHHLIDLAYLILAQHPQDCVDLIHRAADSIISQTNKSAYQEASELLLKLERQLKQNNLDCAILYLMINNIIKTHKLKRNLMKLLKVHFVPYFE